MSEDGARTALAGLVAEELAAPADPAVTAVADAARAAHGGVRAVLFYGSCRRDGYRDGLLVDLYLVTDDYAAVHRSRLMRWLNRLVPPNVYYIDAGHGGGRVRAKYALVSLRQLEQLVSPVTLNPYFWARFAQPTGLLWSRDAQTAAAIEAVMVQSILTTDAAARPLAGGDADPLALWSRAFSESYRTELRAEKPGRAELIVAGDAVRYRRIGAMLAGRAPEDHAVSRGTALVLAPGAGQGTEPAAPRQGIVDVRRGCRLSGLEDQPACGRAGDVQPMGTPPPSPGGAVRPVAPGAGAAPSASRRRPGRGRAPRVLP